MHGRELGMSLICQKKNMEKIELFLLDRRAAIHAIAVPRNICDLSSTFLYIAPVFCSGPLLATYD
jgi:hypothetical protein